MTKCQECEFGGIQKGFFGSIYKFREAVKINADHQMQKIKYSDGELGCRSTANNLKEQECLKNNFCNFIKFTY